MSKNNNEIKHEDLIMKKAMDVFADKFLQGKDLQKVKEEISMTELGRMLIEDGIEKGRKEGIEKGIEQGMEKGKADLLIKMLVKKFKNVPNEYREKIKMLPQDTIEVIGMDIFEMNSINDLEKYF